MCQADGILGVRVGESLTWEAVLCLMPSGHSEITIDWSITGILLSYGLTQFSSESKVLIPWTSHAKESNLWTSSEFWRRKSAVFEEKNFRSQVGTVLTFMDINWSFSCFNSSRGGQDDGFHRGNLWVWWNFHRGSMQLIRESYFVTEFCKGWPWSRFTLSRHPNLNSMFRKYWHS